MFDRLWRVSTLQRSDVDLPVIIDSHVATVRGHRPDGDVTHKCSTSGELPWAPFVHGTSVAGGIYNKLAHLC